MFRLRPFVIAIALVIALPAVVSADAPPGPYFNGFEVNTAGWFNNSGATITRRPDFYPTGIGGYANGVDSATGGYHARLGIDPSPATCTFGGGTANIYSGPFTDWGGYSSIFPTGGYQTRVDVYLDVPWAQDPTHFDRRFDWSSAINTPSGSHRRDFIFNAGTDALGFVISAGTVGNRCNSFPANPGNAPIHITTSGWYTFEHSFTGVDGGPLMVLMRIFDENGVQVPGASWVRSVPTDIIGSTIGGNRYGWFVQNEIDQLAIDNSERTGILSTPGCEIKINNGGSITTVAGDHATFGGNAKVSLSGEASGQQTYQDHRALMPLTFKALTVQAVSCSDDRTEAEIHGTGTVNGMGEFQYRIKLADNGEPGTADEYGIIIPGVGYASGDQTLDGGNVQIR